VAPERQGAKHPCPRQPGSDLKAPVKGCEVKARSRIAIFSARKAVCRPGLDNKRAGLALKRFGSQKRLSFFSCFSWSKIAVFFFTSVWGGCALLP